MRERERKIAWRKGDKQTHKERRLCYDISKLYSMDSCNLHVHFQINLMLFSYLLEQLLLKELFHRTQHKLHTSENNINYNRSR